MGGRPPRRVIEGQLVVLLSSLQFASANKYCAFEIEGEAKYYVCPRNENCCSIGCCVNLAFHFYQLWYYWLLVIFLFMLCSGGGWWFRFCRSSSSNSTRTPTPSNASRYSHSHSHPSNGITSHSLHTAPTSNLRASPRHYHHHSERTCPHHRHQIIAGSNGVAVAHHQRARILHRPCNQRSSMYYLQRIWKGPNEIQQHQLPPSYSTMFFNMLTNGGAANGPTTGAGVAEGDGNGPCAVGLSARPTNCPYYQLYGPPPSYDSVIQLETGEGGATTSCCLVDPPSRIAATEAETVQVNSNQDGEHIIQEIVISEPLPRSSTERLNDDGEGRQRGDVLAAVAIPLISAECDAGRTQPEHYNMMTGTVETTTCQGVDEGPGVSSCFVATSTTTSGAGMQSSSSAARDADEDTAFAAACATSSTAHFEDIPSTSSSA